MKPSSSFSSIAACAGGAVLAACVLFPWPGSRPYVPAAAVTEVLRRIETSYVRKIDEQDLTERALAALAGSLDRWSTYIPPKEYRSFDEDTEGRFGGIGIFYAPCPDGLLLREVLAGSPAWRAGIRKGEVLTHAGELNLAGVDEETVRRMIRGKAGTVLHLTIRNVDGAIRTITVVREIIRDPSVHRVRLFRAAPAIGMLRIERFQRRTAEELDTAMAALIEAGIEGLVIDLRGNPGGLYDEAVAVAGRFLSDAVIVSTIGRDPGSADVRAAQGHARYPSLRIACLVDAQTASAAELVSGALRDHRKAVLVGEPTFGKCLVQSVYELFEDGDTYGALKITTKHYLTPSGSSLAEGGLPVDVPAALDEKTRTELRKAWQEELLSHWNEPAALQPDPVNLGEDAGLAAAVAILASPARYEELLARPEEQR